MHLHFPFLSPGIRRSAIAGTFLLLGALCAGPAGAQSDGSSSEEVLTREQRLELLRLKEAELDLRTASNRLVRTQADLEGMKELFDRQVVSRIDLNRASQDYEDARLAFDSAVIELEKRRLEFLRDATHITIEEAKKFRTGDGKRWTEILLRNASDLDQARILMQAVTDRIPTDEELRGLLRVNGILVSLMDDSIIGEPYEARIDTLDFDESRAVKFQLLKDVDEVTVSLQYLGTNDQRKVFLKKEALQKVPSISSEQFSQEGKLGTKVLFDLTLERLSEEEESFSLVALNLPPQIDARFVNPETKAALNQVKFGKEKSRISLDLELAIPEKLEASLVDEPLGFLVVVARPEDARRFVTAHGEGPVRVREEDLSSFPCSWVKLTLVPRGVGELEMLISNRYSEIRAGHDAQFRAEVHNKGTLAVFNTRFRVDPPYEWNYEVIPDVVDRLDPGQRENIVLRLIPPRDVGVGDYDVRLAAEGEVGNEPVESIEKNVTVRVEARTHLLLNMIVVVIVMALILGIAVTSVRMTRR